MGVAGAESLVKAPYALMLEGLRWRMKVEVEEGGGGVGEGVGGYRRRPKSRGWRRRSGARGGCGGGFGDLSGKEVGTLWAKAGASLLGEKEERGKDASSDRRR